MVNDTLPIKELEELRKSIKKLEEYPTEELLRLKENLGISTANYKILGQTGNARLCRYLIKEVEGQLAIRKSKEKLDESNSVWPSYGKVIP